MEENYLWFWGWSIWSGFCDCHDEDGNVMFLTHVKDAIGSSEKADILKFKTSFFHCFTTCTLLKTLSIFKMTTRQCEGAFKGAIRLYWSIWNREPNLPAPWLPLRCPRMKWGSFRPRNTKIPTPTLGSDMFLNCVSFQNVFRGTGCFPLMKGATDGKETSQNRLCGVLKVG